MDRLAHSDNVQRSRQKGDGSQKEGSASQAWERGEPKIGHL